MKIKVKAETPKPRIFALEAYTTTGISVYVRNNPFFEPSEFQHLRVRVPNHKKKRKQGRYILQRVSRQYPLEKDIGMLRFFFFIPAGSSSLNQSKSCELQLCFTYQYYTVITVYSLTSRQPRLLILPAVPAPIQCAAVQLACARQHRLCCFTAPALIVHDGRRVFQR